MKTDQKIPQWEDIIFETRNKSYGAYELRHSYNDRLTKSFIITLSGAAILMLLIFLLRTKPKPNLFTETKIPVDLSTIFDTNDLIKPIEVKQEKTGRVISNPDKQSFLLVTDSEKTEKLIDTADVGFVSNADTASGIVAGLTTDTFAFSANQPSQKTLSLGSVDKAPDFPGGLEKFYKFLIKRLHYTHEAKKAGLNAKMYVSFVVDEEGLISEVKVLSKVGYGLDEQVQSVLLESPKWLPGIYRNMPVKTEMVLPVSFNLIK